MVLFLTALGISWADEFKYDKIYENALGYTVVVTIETEVSFGTQATEMENRSIGTIVDSHGLVIFDGRPIDSDNPFSSMTGILVNTEPKKIKVETTDGQTYEAEYIGIDRYTKLGFCRIADDKKNDFKFLRFSRRDNIKIGEMLMSLMLLPRFVSPPFSADIGMVSAIVDQPEEFILTIGFNEMEIASVLYDSTGAAIGVLGFLDNPGNAGFGTGMMNGCPQIED
jgi:hypothetical protein